MSIDSLVLMVTIGVAGLWCLDHPGWDSVVSVSLGVVIGLYLGRVRFAKELDFYDRRPRD